MLESEVEPSRLDLTWLKGPSGSEQRAMLVFSENFGLLCFIMLDCCCIFDTSLNMNIHIQVMLTCKLDLTSCYYLESENKVSVCSLTVVHRNSLRTNHLILKTQILTNSLNNVLASSSCLSL